MIDRSKFVYEVFPILIGRPERKKLSERKTERERDGVSESEEIEQEEMLTKQGLFDM